MTRTTRVLLIGMAGLVALGAGVVIAMGAGQADPNGPAVHRVDDRQHGTPPGLEVSTRETLPDPGILRR